MHRPQRFQRKYWRRRDPPPPVTLTRRESLGLVALGVIACIAAVLFIHFVGGWKARSDRERSLATMQVEYSLTETQLAVIRKIEACYHGTGSVFTRPSHSFKEEAAHRLVLSQQMSSEAAARFLDTRKKSVGFTSHKH